MTRHRVGRGVLLHSRTVSVKLRACVGNTNVFQGLMADVRSRLDGEVTLEGNSHNCSFDTHFLNQRG